MNRREVIQSLELSSAAYRDVQPYSPHTCTAMIESAQSGVQCFIRASRDVLWITFRGTDSPGEWKSNFAFWQQTIPYANMESKIRVHAGFIGAYKAPGVRDKILASVTSGLHKIRLSGHSRGAALAILCAVDMQYHFPDRDIEVVVFGCPRVGNKAFAQSYNKRVDKTLRVENGNDIVTKVPFPLMGYKHVGASFPIGPRRVLWRFSARDHYPHRYYSALLTKLWT